MNKSQLLKKYITSKETLIMPDAFDPLSARLIELSAYKAVQCSGLSFSISSCYIKESQYSFEENLAITENIVNAVDVPVMADGEDGFGPPEDVYKTIKLFLKTGIAGINIEDQILSGKNEGSVVNVDLMTDKIKIARKAAIDFNNKYFIINARTDVIDTIKSRKKGLIQAIDRSNIFLEAGADMAFITYIKTKDELKQIVKEVNGPVSISAGIPYTMVDFTVQDCKELGINRLSLPTALIFGAIQGMKNILENLHQDNDLLKLFNNKSFCTKEYFNNIILSK